MATKSAKEKTPEITPKKTPAKKKDEARIKALMEKRFLTLEEMAELSGRKPEEITAYIEVGVLTHPDCYCYPCKREFPVGDGHQPAFFGKNALAAIDAAKA